MSEIYAKHLRTMGVRALEWLAILHCILVLDGIGHLSVNVQQNEQSGQDNVGKEILGSEP